MNDDSPALSEAQVAKVIDRTGLTSVTRILVFAAALGYLFDGFDNTILGYLMPLISKEFAISPEWKGLILSLALWGGVLGMAVWGPVAETKGRRFAFQGTVLSFSLFTGMAAFAWTSLSLGITRFISGAGLAGFYAVDLAMVSEMAPTKVRGRLTSLITILYPVGVILAGLTTGLLATKIGWRAVFLVGVIPAFCAYIVRRHVPESPRWLASKGRTVDAMQSLLRMGAAQQTIDDARNELSEITAKASACIDQATVREKLKELFSKRWLSANAVSWTLWITANFAAWGVTLWLPTILVDTYHFSFANSVFYLTITYGFGLLGRLSGLFLIDRIGRKPLIAVSFVVAAAACLGFGIVRAPSLLLFFIVIHKFFDQQGALGVMGYLPELYPTTLRVMGNAYAGSASRITSAAAPIMVGVLIGMHHFLTIWALFAAVYFVGSIVLMILGPETKGKTLEECTRTV
jgi:putative MFS transporter